MTLDLPSSEPCPTLPQQFQVINKDAFRFLTQSRLDITVYVINILWVIDNTKIRKGNIWRQNVTFPTLLALSIEKKDTLDNQNKNKIWHLPRKEHLIRIPLLVHCCDSFALTSYEFGVVYFTLEIALKGPLQDIIRILLNEESFGERM